MNIVNHSVNMQRCSRLIQNLLMSQGNTVEICNNLVDVIKILIKRLNLEN